MRHSPTSAQNNGVLFFEHCASVEKTPRRHASAGCTHLVEEEALMPLHRRASRAEKIHLELGHVKVKATVDVAMKEKRAREIFEDIEELLPIIQAVACVIRRPVFEKGRVMRCENDPSIAELRAIAKGPQRAKLRFGHSTT